MAESLFLAITARRAEVLRELVEGYTQREVADHLGISTNGVRSHIEELRSIANCSSTRELARWWRLNREQWAAVMCAQAGVSRETIATGQTAITVHVDP